MRLWLLTALIIFNAGCMSKPAPRSLDSSATKAAVESLSGKPMRVFHGPAEILGDTAKNRRSFGISN